MLNFQSMSKGRDGSFGRSPYKPSGRGENGFATAIEYIVWNFGLEASSPI